MHTRTTTWLRAFRQPTVRSWLSAVLVALLLLAEVVAVTHPLDLAAHANGEPCNVCLSFASFGHAAVAKTPDLGVDTTLPIFVVVAGERSFAATILLRPPVRGPPTLS